MKRTVSSLPFNLDPKLVGTVLTATIVYALTRLLHLDVSPDAKAAIATIVAFATGYLLPPADTARR